MPFTIPRLLLLTPLLLLGCVDQTAVGGLTFALSAHDKTLECPARSGQPPTVPNQYPCVPYDEAVGGEETCCGGDLPVQSCGNGLSCQDLAGDGIGVCLDFVPPIPTVCIDVRDNSVPTSYHGLDAYRTDVTDCRLMAQAGDAFYVLSCMSGECTCSNYSAVITTDIPVESVCGQALADSLAVAVSRCNFPTTYTFKNTAGWN